MKKILCLILVVFTFLTGCLNKNYTSQKNKDLIQKDVVTYSYEDVDGTITSIDMRYWFATCPRWRWEISVEYDGMTFDDDGWANGAINKPNFAGSDVGDSIRIEITNKYVNGEISERYISKIK